MTRLPKLIHGGEAAVLARNVRRARGEISQPELAKLAGVSRATIAAIESARYSSVRSQVLLSVARALGVEPGDLLKPKAA